MEHGEDQVKTERKKEWKGLLMAFNLLDEAGTSHEGNQSPWPSPPPYAYELISSSRAFHSSTLGRGYIKFDQWLELMSVLKPKARRAELRFFYELLDRDGNDQLDCFDFCDLREILQLRAHRLTDDENHSWLALHFLRLVTWAEEYVATRPS